MCTNTIDRCPRHGYGRVCRRCRTSQLGGLWLWLCPCCLGNLSQNVRNSLSLIPCRSVGRTERRSPRLSVIYYHLYLRDRSNVLGNHTIVVQDTDSKSRSFSCVALKSGGRTSTPLSPSSFSTPFSSKININRNRLYFPC